jgi:electron transport complex protein RnfE
MEQKQSKLSILTRPLIAENPSLVLLLGTCPTLATTTSVINGMSMGLATTFVLACSNMAISLIRKIVPEKVRIPCYIVVIACFSTIVGMILEAFFPAIYSALGVFIALIVVNCIVLGRAEMFASKNGIVDSFLDGTGNGLGFTLALTLIGSFRELLGSGSLFGLRLIPASIPAIPIFTMAPGGFFAFGCAIAFVSFITRGKAPVRRDFGCGGCPMLGSCSGGCSENNDAKGAGVEA